MTGFEREKLALEERSGGKNTLIMDDIGNPSVMVRIPKFKWSDVIDGAEDETCSAFIVDGKEYDCIYISKYLNVIEHGRAYSLPDRDPAHSINIDEARAACRRKGPGWHLMTNMEWMAIAHWCRKNGIAPRGNNDCGASVDAPEETGIITPKTYPEVPRESRTISGSGPDAWSHDLSPWGIDDMVGNLWDFVAGLRTVRGEIQIIPGNESALNVDESVDSPLWRAIMPDGTLVAPGTPGTYKIDNMTYSVNNESSAMVPGGVHLTTELRNPHNDVDPEGDLGYAMYPFGMLKAEDGLTAHNILVKIGMFPGDGDYKEVFFIRNTGERIPARGGSWFDKNGAGLFELYMRDHRRFRYPDIGFRSAYIELV